MITTTQDCLDAFACTRYQMTALGVKVDKRMEWRWVLTDGCVRESDVEHMRALDYWIGLGTHPRYLGTYLVRQYIGRD